MTDKLDTHMILDSLGHGVLIFDQAGKFIHANRSAGTLLGTDLNILRSEGWSAALGLFNTGLTDKDERLESVRERALAADRAVRFRIYRSGEYIPCWAAAYTAKDGSLGLVLTLDVPDWGLVSSVIDRFRSEVSEAIETTIGHIRLIHRTIDAEVEDDPTISRLGRRLSGFTRLITIHMSRANRLMQMLERLEDIRTGRVRDLARQQRKKINLDDFFEDFVEELNEIELLDPETEVQDYRARLEIESGSNLKVSGSSRYLAYTLRELLRNAIMYSLRGMPIRLRAFAKANHIIIELSDEGYGVRQNDYEAVFAPFTRGRQPQVISEFGYGLGLYLCKHEIEAMNGRMWFNSEEGVGTTFSLMLPMWQDTSSSESSKPSA